MKRVKLHVVGENCMRREQLLENCKVKKFQSSLKAICLTFCESERRDFTENLGHAIEIPAVSFSSAAKIALEERLIKSHFLKAKNQDFKGWN